MRVRLWLKSTRISVATCQKERIVRRYFSLHWGAGAMPRKETWHGHEERSASCNITIKAFTTPRALTKRPYKNPYNHHGNTAAKIHSQLIIKNSPLITTPHPLHFPKQAYYTHTTKQSGRRFTKKELTCLKSYTTVLSPALLAHATNSN